MPKGYWKGHMGVRDPKTSDIYCAANAEPFAKYDAKFLVRGGSPDVV